MSRGKVVFVAVMVGGAQSVPLSESGDQKALVVVHGILTVKSQRASSGIKGQSLV